MKAIIDKPDIQCLTELTAFEVGQALRIDIKKSGLTAGAVRQVRRIVEHHPDITLHEFIQGLVG
jgi:hypothetical protein